MIAGLMDDLQLRAAIPYIPAAEVIVMHGIRDIGHLDNEPRQEFMQPVIEDLFDIMATSASSVACALALAVAGNVLAITPRQPVQMPDRLIKRGQKRTRLSPFRIRKSATLLAVMSPP